jgi:hypothetical protein
MVPAEGKTMDSRWATGLNFKRLKFDQRGLPRRFLNAYMVVLAATARRLQEVET